MWGVEATGQGMLGGGGQAAPQRSNEARRLAHAAEGSRANRQAHLATGVLVPAMSSSVVTMPGLRLQGERGGEGRGQQAR